jgi:hypothetical protein
MYESLLHGGLPLQPVLLMVRRFDAERVLYFGNGYCDPGGRGECEHGGDWVS